MKRYSVYVEFLNGQDMQFMTDTNVLTLKPVHVNGAEMIMTQDQYGINLVQVKKMEVVEIGRGKIGEFVGSK
ncbi:hypothetical protein M3152_10930 [Sporosarcina luteola]|uniref:hypothetical protein n=1 Tax=Sporosarcina luteola TaxID=582850 RepID=UPI002040A331|nr:hypothetical protein [Sporosarcina luteola]MCM3638239.1 hypothetical protein [Sporosarcina luteola]